MNNEESWGRLIQEFLLECADSIGLIERGLLELETNPKNKGLIDDVFRHTHTVKGNCLMLGFTKLEELTHSAETVMELLRDGMITMDSGVSSTLLAVVDSVVATLKSIERTGTEGDGDYTELMGRLNHIAAAAAMSAGAGFSKNTAAEPPDGGGSTFNTEDSSLNLETVTLPISRLNTLMNVVGTVLVTFNQLRYSLTQNRGDYHQLLDTMEQQIQNLQDEVLQYRLQPVGHIWNTFHRLVREVAVDSGKKVYLQMKGEDTEVDRSVLISLKNILGHMIRNAIDHGIEPPDVRLSRGKPAVGRVLLSGEQRHGNIYMEISDDGAGIDVGKVREKAVALGLLTPQQASAIDDASAFNLIMEPGFSTADSLSKISGRGIGMDVVKSTVEKAGGVLSVSSTVGKGTCFSIRVPQSMAIVPVLVVRSMDERFAIPQVNVIELVSFYGDEVREKVQIKLNSPMVSSRGQLIPMVRLSQIQGQYGGGGGHELLSKGQCHVVMLRSEGGEFGLEVDGAEELANLVIKPLARIFSHINILSGSAVMPDGTVSFLLNIEEVRKEGMRLELPG
ncbi:chemotaxis protein CheA [Candidatus Magnetominusculus dajiuhuensis]|uniref:chemotaxis protein CheA n=1 Tax=Candidatus Magnetominusculus dajiuhuensis TaxID=3137712 RepID=UPI003B43CDDB